MADHSQAFPAAGTKEGRARQHLERILGGLACGLFPRDLALAADRQFSG